MTSKELEVLFDKVNQVNNAGYEKASYIIIPEEIYDKVVKKEEVSPQDTPAIKKIGNTTYRELLDRRELQVLTKIVGWRDDMKYILLYGTGSYTIVVGNQKEADEEIIESYLQSLRSK